MHLNHLCALICLCYSEDGLHNIRETSCQYSLFIFCSLFLVLYIFSCVCYSVCVPLFAPFGASAVSYSGESKSFQLVN